MIQKIKRLIDDHKLDKPNRKREIIYFRCVLYVKLRKEGVTLEKIAKMFNKNHATIFHGLQQYDKLKKYSDFQEVMQQVEVILLTEVPQSVFAIELTQFENELLKANTNKELFEVKLNLINYLNKKIKNIDLE